MRFSVLLCLVYGMFLPVSQARDIHISPGGSDTASGDAGHPIATLPQAANLLKAQPPGPEEAVRLILHQGTYRLDHTFEVAALRVGQSSAPIEITGSSGEDAVLTGGRLIPPEEFQMITSPTDQKRLDPQVVDQVRVVDLTRLGVGSLGEFPDRFTSAPFLPELFFNQKRMTLARWPNEDWAEIARVVESGPAPWRNHASDKKGCFEYEGDRPARWLNAPSVWLQGYWCFDWSCETVRAAAIDSENRRITLSVQPGYGVGSGNPAPRRFFALNLLEELDHAGEYFIDRERSLLFFYPPGDLSTSETVLSTLVSPLISLDRVSNVRLHNIILQEGAGTGIRVTDGRGNRIEGCTIRRMGLDAITVQGGEEHGIFGCDIHDIGTSGISLQGGDRQKLIPSRHQAIDNHIWNVSQRQRTHAFHLHIGGVGVVARNNLLHDGPHQAIGLLGNDHIIELNEIHHTGMETDDCGAFYMGRNPSERGNVIRYNYWHDIGSKLSHGSCAVYFDDGTCGQKVFGNVFVRAAGGNFGAVFIHGGHNNLVENNLFVRCKRAIGHSPWDPKLWREWLDGDLWKERLFKEVDISSSLYTGRYPDLIGFMQSDGVPRRNQAVRNIAIYCDSFSKGDWDLTDNLEVGQDPGFYNEQSEQFTFKPDAEVFSEAKGFTPIPWGQIGLKRDPD